MRGFKRFILVSVSLLVVLATIVFMLENQQPISLVFFGWNAPALSAAIPLIAAFLAGMVVSPILVILFRLQRRRRRVVSAD